MKSNRLFALVLTFAFVAMALVSCVSTPSTSTTSNPLLTFTTHTHSYVYEATEGGHMEICDICGEGPDVLYEHTYGADDTCTACGAEKPEPPHEHEYVYTESGEGHVGTCACNATTEVLPHTYGADDKCTACGAEKPSVTPPVPGDDEGDFSGRY